MNSMRRLHDILAEGEEWLTARIIQYAKARGYTMFTSTLEQAWRLSIQGLSGSFLAALDEGRVFTAVAAEVDYDDPVASYGMEAARRHFTRGVTLGLFVGLMKSYRQSYLDLVVRAATTDEERESWSEAIRNFFDRIEAGICNEWGANSTDEEVEQLRAHNRLITNEKNRYLTIFESLNDPVFLLRKDGRLDNMNRAAATLFSESDASSSGSYGPAEIYLKDVIGLDVVTASDNTCECELETRLGRRWFGVRTQRMLDVSEKYLGTVVILVEVTEYRKAKLDAEAANRAKSTFLAAMSHEIRTPIHGILGLADLLGRSRLEPRARGWVEAITRSGEVLSSVISDILDYSKIEAGVLDLERVEFSPMEVVEDVAGLMRPIAARKPELDLVVEMPKLPIVVGDGGKLRQILLNLVGNAIKFTERGTVWIAVEELIGPGESWALRFTVADTGIGIAPEQAATIFEPFTQSDVSVARRFGGSGLGLAICRSLVDQLGGTIGFDSKLGEGSRFYVTVSFERAKSHPTADESNETTAVLPTRALDVLVVEDNEVNALVARGLIERFGHRPLVAFDGRSAVAAAAEQRFDLILLDLRLPDMDGIEVARQIRAFADRGKAEVPIVALSAQVLRDDIAAVRAAGVNDFLGKPFSAKRLEAMFRRVLGVASPQSVQPSPPHDVDSAYPAQIDPSVISEHVEALGFEQTARIVKTWCESSATYPAAFERALSADDRPAIADLAHRLKSSSRHVGLLRVSAFAAETEQAARGAELSLPSRVNTLLEALTDGDVILAETWRALQVRQPAKT